MDTPPYKEFADPIPVKLHPNVIEPYRKPDIKKADAEQSLNL